ncbi:SDR family NAD(P)-dependent oxidoreductase [Achromobacter sp. UMC46]|uniref:SDR family NAD(P)-dependent oxidoreductase n=1 Tax=Achromobacter sp. UMC46 TaxID=1862319 RepID=UPI0016044F52|nr:glucose 1-dehydrogenase [Achromobacter sp. UMC46]MBB1593409.1 oxidoreductase [Achromobacter sp. UMC46]
MILKDKVAVITGGSSGIGLAIAMRFAAEGAEVVITGRRQAELDRAIAEIGGRASAFRADVSKLADADALYEFVGNRYGRVDILVANAGTGVLAPLGAISEAQFDQEFGVNVKGLLFTVQNALPLLSEGSAVVLTGSIASITGTAGFSVYSATKAAVRALARGWILDLKDKGIRLNVLSPGPIRTPLLTGLVPPDQEQVFLESLADRIPLGRIGEPDEIAKAAVFLASDASSFVNGIELFVDGGMAQV